MTEITPQELKKKREEDNKLTIIDVRECWEYDEANINPTLNIPLGDLPDNLALLPEDKSSPIVVHCQSGRRSAQAQKYLTKQGYTNVASLSGGIEAYLNT